MGFKNSMGLKGTKFKDRFKEAGKNRKWVVLYVLMSVAITMILVYFAVGYFQETKLNDRLEEKAFECKSNNYGIVLLDKTTEGWQLRCWCKNEDANEFKECLDDIPEDQAFLNIYELNLTFIPKAI